MKPEYVYVVTSKLFGRIIGTFVDHEIATKVARCNNGSITKVVLDAVYPGHLKAVREIYGESAGDTIEAAVAVRSDVVRAM